LEITQQIDVHQNVQSHISLIIALIYVYLIAHKIWIIMQIQIQGRVLKIVPKAYHG